MQTQVSTTDKVPVTKKRRILRMLPWFVSVLSLAALVTREAVHQNAKRKIDQLDDLVWTVYRAASPGAEKRALEALAEWSHSERVGVSLRAYNVATGEKIPMSQIGEQKVNMAFEAGFDFNWDYQVERRYPLYLKDPWNVLLLTRGGKWDRLLLRW